MTRLRAFLTCLLVLIASTAVFVGEQSQTASAQSGTSDWHIAIDPDIARDLECYADGVYPLAPGGELPDHDGVAINAPIQDPSTGVIGVAYRAVARYQNDATGEISYPYSCVTDPITGVQDACQPPVGMPGFIPFIDMTTQVVSSIACPPAHPGNPAMWSHHYSAQVTIADDYVYEGENWSLVEPVEFSFDYYRTGALLASPQADARALISPGCPAPSVSLCNYFAPNFPMVKSGSLPLYHVWFHIESSTP